MNRQLIEPFSDAFINVLPQFGFADVSCVGETVCERRIDTPGVVVILGIVGDVHGNVIFSMSEESAKKIASIMMCMDVADFDEMAQSAVSEMGNMLAAHACIVLSGNGFDTNISTPTLMYGTFSTSASFDNVIRLEMNADGLPFYIYISLEQKSK